LANATKEAYSKIAGIVPAPTVIKYLKYIADYIYQSSIFALYKIDQE
jgi:hypothetical protein